MTAQSMTTARAGALSTRWRRIRRNRQILTFCYVALAPVLALFFYVRVIPIIESVGLSFYRWDLIKPAKPFIGLRNYTDLLGDENFLLALGNTLIYSVASVYGPLSSNRVLKVNTDLVSGVLSRPELTRPRRDRMHF